MVIWDNDSIKDKQNGGPNLSQTYLSRIKLLSKRTDQILRHIRGPVLSPSHYMDLLSSLSPIKVFIYGVRKSPDKGLTCAIVVPSVGG